MHRFCDEASQDIRRSGGIRQRPLDKLNHPYFVYIVHRPFINIVCAVYIKIELFCSVFEDLSYYFKEC